MIKILLVSNEENEFSKFESGGHAGQAAAGSDIVCSAVTVLLKTAVLSLISAEKSGSGLKIKVKAKTRGKLSAEVLSFSQEDKPRLRYLFEFLTMGLISVKEQYPDCLDLQIKEGAKSPFNKIFGGLYGT